MKWRIHKHQGMKDTDTRPTVQGMRNTSGDLKININPQVTQFIFFSNYWLFKEKSPTSVISSSKYTFHVTGCKCLPSNPSVLVNIYNYLGDTHVTCAACNPNNLVSLNLKSIQPMCKFISCIILLLLMKSALSLCGEINIPTKYGTGWN